MSAPVKIDPGAAAWTIQALARLICTFAILIGFAIIVGGEQRWLSPSFEVALRYPAAPESWGVVILAFGSVGLLGSLLDRYVYVKWPLYLIAVWALFFAGNFAVSAYQYALASNTGPLAYGTLGVVSLVLGVAHRRDKEI